MAADEYTWVGDFARRIQVEGEARGRCQGEAAAILTVLDERNITMTRQQCGLINECADEAILHVWLRRALTATTAEEIFD